MGFACQPLGSLADGLLVELEPDLSPGVAQVDERCKLEGSFRPVPLEEVGGVPAPFMEVGNGRRQRAFDVVRLRGTLGLGLDSQKDFKTWPMMK